VLRWIAALTMVGAFSGAGEKLVIDGGA